MQKRIFILFVIITSFFLVKILTAQYYWKIMRQVDYETQYNDIDFVDKKNGWIVGYKLSRTPGGLILHTNDGGETWDYQFQSLEERLVAVDFSDSLHGWALGVNETASDSNGIILYTRNSGKNWIPELSIIQNWWEPIDVCFIDSLTGWIIGNNPQKIYYTTDGGEKWELQYEKPGRGLSQVFFVDSQQGWAVGQNILHTIDGGRNWEIQYESNAYRRFFGCYFINSQMGWVTGEIGEIVPNNVILKTLDSGLNWNVYNIFEQGYSLDNITFVDSLTGWVVGRRPAWISMPALLKTSNGGEDWYPEEVEMQHGTLFSICCIDSCTGWAVGDEGMAGYGIVLKYTRKPNHVHGDFPAGAKVESFNLFKNYPNPFNLETSILFYLPEAAYVSVLVYDINGRLVKRLIQGEVLLQGNHKIFWNGRNRYNENVSSGVYLCCLKYENHFQVKKLIALK